MKKKQSKEDVTAPRCGGGGEGRFVVEVRERIARGWGIWEGPA